MIILVAGVHGVGKTYLGAAIAKQLGIIHVTASDLIRGAREGQSWDDSKNVRNVDENQALLISAVTNLKQENRSVLLDGHCVLRGSNGTHVDLNESVFRSIGVDAIILIENDPETILYRLVNRGDVSWTRPEIEKFALREKDRAKFISLSLNVPFFSIYSPDETQFERIVQLALATKSASSSMLNSSS